MTFDYFLTMKMYPRCGADGRAFWAATALHLLDGMRPQDIRAGDLDLVPDIYLMRRLMRGHSERLMRGPVAQREGCGRVGALLMAKTLGQLLPSVRKALGRMPRSAPPPVDVFDPHADPAAAPAHRRVVARATAGAERELRDRIAAGELPASMLATRMHPAKPVKAIDAPKVIKPRGPRR